MGFKEAGDILLDNTSPKISLGFVSAVQRGYDVVISRTGGDAEAASTSSQEALGGTNKQPGPATSFFCGRGTNEQSEQGTKSDSILARLDAEISHLKTSSAETSPTQSSRSSTNSNASFSPSSLPAILKSGHKKNSGLAADSPPKQVLVMKTDCTGNPSKSESVCAETQTDSLLRDLADSMPADEQKNIIKQLVTQNETLINSLHEARKKNEEVEVKIHAAVEAAKASERRAKAAEARLAIIKAELGSLKQQGRLEEPAAKIHDAMLTPKHGTCHGPTFQMPYSGETAASCIPEKPLLQIDVGGREGKGGCLQAQRVHELRAPRCTGATAIPVAGRKELARSCNFVYMNCLAAYPATTAASGTLVCSDPLAYCAPQATPGSSPRVSAPVPRLLPKTSVSTLKASDFFSQGDMLEARLLGVNHSEIPKEDIGSVQEMQGEDLQRLVSASTVVGGQSGEDAKIAIAFVTDFLPTWTSCAPELSPSPSTNASLNSLDESINSMDFSRNISRELSRSPCAIRPGQHRTGSGAGRGEGEGAGGGFFVATTPRHTTGSWCHTPGGNVKGMVGALHASSNGGGGGGGGRVGGEKGMREVSPKASVLKELSLNVDTTSPRVPHFNYF